MIARVSIKKILEMEKPDMKVSSYVDHYFLNHSHTRQSHSPSPKCSACSSLQAPHCPRHAKETISRNDIDMLQLMNPSMTPEKYMDNIMTLYKKEQNLRCRQEKNQPMQLALSTKRIMSHKHSLSSVQQQPDEEEDPISHHDQFRTDKKTQEHIRKLRDQCYLGLGKLIISRKQKKNRVQLERANYHTRQYLLPNAKEEMERLQEKADLSQTKKYYIIANANARGVNFQPQDMPSGLQYVLEPFKYREIMCTVNQIIQRTVYNHKRSQFSHKNINPLYIWLMVGLIVVVSLLLLNSLQIHSLGVEMSCLVGSLCLILFILMISCHQFHKELDYVPLLERINSGITEYLNYLNSRPGTILKWSTPSHLYWIQICTIQNQHKFLGKSYLA